VNEANDQVGVRARIANRNFQLGPMRCRGDLATWLRVNVANREHSDFFSTGQREKTWIASLPRWCFNSDWLNFFPKQMRCGIV
jgi:hypothetical protein